MRILLLCSTFNSLTQRVFTELREDGHAVATEIDAHESLTHAAIDRHAPALVIAPFLRRAIPPSVTARVRCLVVHPGPPGDGGPAALDHAILDGEARWGVTVLEATETLDAGPIHASRAFAMRDGATKSDLYANEVTEAALDAIREAIDAIERGVAAPSPPDIRRFRAKPVEAARAIDFETMTTETVLRRIASADGMPGARARIGGREVRVFDAHREDTLAGRPGRLVARRENAVCVATRDGAVWIGHAKPIVGEGAERGFKQAATTLLADLVAELPGSPPPAPWITPARATFQDIRYREDGPVGTLTFDFYNGGMSARQARRLLAAIEHAEARPTRVLVLTGGRRFWSTGMDLMSIEAARSAAEASMETIEAIDDVALALLTMTDKLTIAALGGSAGAGGAFLALACDEVVARAGVVLNPHYKNMGNLYGSEYWTYVLPRRVGSGIGERVVGDRLPLGARAALRMGLVDALGPRDPDEFARWRDERAGKRARDPDLAARLAAKARVRAEDEAAKPLAAYRAAELARMRLAFHGFDPSYHVARYNFIAKVPQSRTPRHLMAPAALATPLAAE